MNLCFVTFSTDDRRKGGEREQEIETSTMIPAEEKRERTEKHADKVEIIVGATNTYIINIAPIQMNGSLNLIDRESTFGRFGWITLEQKYHIPYIMREDEKYCAVRMVEPKLLAPYLTSISYDIYYNCTNIPSYHTTESERWLLNEINLFHCDYQFGKTAFSQWDLIIRLDDAIEFYKFLLVCYKKLFNVNVLSGNCGFTIIDETSVVPFVMYNEEKYLPLFYFEGAEHLQANAKMLTGWHLSYLKFCYKIQGIRDEYLKQEICAAISLNDVKQYFPLNTVFKDFWPSSVAALRRYPVNKSNTKGWYRQPNV